MDKFTKEISIRWSDIDANYHMRHTAYYDFGAQLRMDCLEQAGLSLKVLEKMNLGPVLFREEALFKREIRYEDKITINLKLSKLKRDYSRVSMQHELMRSDGTICSVITVDAAWIDTKLRKLTVPPIEVTKAFEEFPRTDNFTWIE